MRYRWIEIILTNCYHFFFPRIKLIEVGLYLFMAVPLKRGESEEVTGGSTSYKKKPRLLSCQRCRSRKIRCNYEYPCSNCIKNGTDCVKTIDDMRKKRFPATYVNRLEKRLNELVGLITQAKNADSAKAVLDLIESIDENKLAETEISDGGDKQEVLNQLDSLHDIEIHDADNSSSVYGPTSVYDSDLISKRLRSQKLEEMPIGTLNKDPIILHCIKLFFTWQYPDHNMFIFREAFLIDFFNPTQDSMYCSRVLVLSLCALGSKMSEDDKIYSRSVHFYKEAKSLLLSQLDRPSITSVQSFFLLAFYDICHGSNSSGWMLSGNAIRMGYDLGFQLDPKVWFLKPHNDLSPLDVAIRSRVYWGSYVADHFISLLLGRPSLLKKSDATIAESNDLPNLEWIDDYMYIDPKDKHKTKTEIFQISNPLRSIINLINISDNILNDIFTKTEDDHDSKDNDDLNLKSRMKKLTEYNTQIKRWKKSLPPEIAWDKNTLETTADNPTFMSIRYYYYILLLCLNRPFVSFSKDLAKQEDFLPSEICAEAIDDLLVAIQRFKKVHGLRRASIFIVYCSILSLSVILLTSSSEPLTEPKQKMVDFFLDVLQGCSRTWRLADKSYKLIKLKLHNDSNASEAVSQNEGQVKVNEKARTMSRVRTLDTAASLGLGERYSGGSKNVHSYPEAFESVTNTNSEHTNPDASRDEAHSDPIIYDHGPAAVTKDAVSFFHDNNTLSHSQKPVFNSQTDLEESNFTNNAEGLDIQEELDKSQRGRNGHHDSIIDSLLTDETLEFFGGPPVLMTSDLFNEDWGSLFPDNIFNPKHT